MEAQTSLSMGGATHRSKEGSRRRQESLASRQVVNSWRAWHEGRGGAKVAYDADTESWMLTTSTESPYSRLPSYVLAAFDEEYAGLCVSTADNIISVKTLLTLSSLQRHQRHCATRPSASGVRHLCSRQFNVSKHAMWPQPPGWTARRHRRFQNGRTSADALCNGGQRALSRELKSKQI